MTVDELQVLITANTKDLRKEIASANQSLSGLKKSADKQTAGVSSAFRKLKSGLVALGIGKVIRDSIASGMDAIESDSLFQTVMGENTQALRTWSAEVSEAFGLSAVNLQKNIGVLYNMTGSMGVAEENALNLSKGVSLLAEDMASFYNLDSEEAFTKLRAGLTGETEPLKALGILVDENTVKQVAYSEGIAENGAELSQQQKVLARYVAILKQTGNAQGDLARTLDSPSNQLRSLKQNVQNLGIALSNFFMPAVKTVLPWLNALAKVAAEALTKLASLLGFTDGGAREETQKTLDNVSGIRSGMDQANQSAKQLKGTLAGFDEMNVLSEDDEGSGESASGASADGADTGFTLGEYPTHLDQITAKTDEIVGKIRTAFAGLGEFLGGIGTFLKTTWDGIWNSQALQAFVGAVMSYGQFLWEYWGTLGSNLSENISMTWSNISGNLSATWENLKQLWTLFWTEIRAGIQQWGQPIIDKVSGLFQAIWKTAIDPYLQLISRAWADFSGILVSLWEQYGQPLVDKIGAFINTTVGLFRALYDRILEPIIKPFLKMFQDLWDNHIKGLIGQIGDFIAKLVCFALDIYNKFIAPIVKWIMTVLSPIVTWIANSVTAVISTVVAFVVDTAKGILKSLGGLIDFITGVFSGNWQKAWRAIRDFFGGIWDAIWGMVKGVVNLIIDGINLLWGGIYAAVSGIINGLGGIAGAVGDLFGQDWHFSMPAEPPLIPKLARGGIVDSPTFAMIGEAGKEAVLPLERNTDWMDRLAETLSGKIGGGAGRIQVVVNLGEETIFDRLIEYGREKAFETNGEAVFI